MIKTRSIATVILGIVLFLYLDDTIDKLLPNSSNAETAIYALNDIGWIPFVFNILLIALGITALVGLLKGKKWSLRALYIFAIVGLINFSFSLLLILLRSNEFLEIYLKSKGLISSQEKITENIYIMFFAILASLGSHALLLMYSIQAKKYSALFQKYGDLEGIICKFCHHEGPPKAWLLRRIFAGVLLALSIFPGIVFVIGTNPFICSKCHRRQGLKKIFADKKEVKIKNLPKWIFTIATLILVLFLAQSTAENLKKKMITSINNTQLNEAYLAGDTDGAIRLLLSNIENAPDNDFKSEALIRLGYVYIFKDDVSNGVKYFKEALTLTEENSFNYHLMRGEIAFYENGPSIALYNYEKAYQLNPDDPNINTTLMQFYTGKHGIETAYTDFKKACPYAKRMLATEPGSEQAKEGMAMCYFAMEEYDQAINLLLQTNISTKENNNAALGFAYLKKNDIPNAKKYFLKAQSLGYALEPETKKIVGIRS